jgi:predicted enzyme related to lactoylglutathione lyase
MSRNVDVARPFYEQLFGWTATELPTDMGPTYTMFMRDGKNVAGMGPLPPDLATAGVPSTWNSYIIVDSVDEVLKAVEAAGGTVPMPAMDVMTEGRMAMIADPSGGIVGLWEPRDHPGGELFNAPGSLAWNELQSRNLDAARDFYADVFSWRWEPMAGEMEYYTAHLDTKQSEDTANCGAMNIVPTAPAGMPSTWMVYFSVEDCDTSLARAEELGGYVFLPAMEMGPGRFAGVSDPTGAMFFLGSYPTG